MSSKGRVCIVTGANTGLGLGVTRRLGEEGYHVVMACRSQEKAETAMADLRKDLPQAELTFIQLDVSKQASVRTFVEQFEATKLPLHLLLNNAGFSYDFKDTQIHVNDDGMEMTMATNYFGHVLLTELMLPLLEKAAAEGADARVVLVSSDMHNKETASKQFKFDVIDISDINYEKNPQRYTGVQAYKDSKLALVMYMYTLHRRLRGSGSGVTVNALCPGFIPATNFLRNASWASVLFVRYFVGGILKLFGKVVTRSVQEAVTDMMTLSTSEDLKGVSGKYYSYGKEAKSSDESYDEVAQQQLWEVTRASLHLDG